MKWTGDDIPDLSSKIIVITGANSGIGKSAALEFAKKKATIILGCRNPQYGEECEKELREATQNETIYYMPLDLADKKSILDFSDHIKRQFPRVDILLNNAGVCCPPFALTVDGYEMQFGVNHIGHYLLTAYLLEWIGKSPAGRIVIVSSLAYHYGKVDFQSLKQPSAAGYNRFYAYANSKLANLLFMRGLANRLTEAKVSNVIAVACHPGWTRTRLNQPLRQEMWVIRMIFTLVNPLFQDSEMGCLPSCYACVHTDVKNGEYYGPDGWSNHTGYPVREEIMKKGLDEEAIEGLWNLSEELTGVTFPFDKMKPVSASSQERTSHVDVAGDANFKNAAAVAESPEADEEKQEEIQTSVQV